MLQFSFRDGFAVERSVARLCRLTTRLSAWPTDGGPDLVDHVSRRHSADARRWNGTTWTEPEVVATSVAAPAIAASDGGFAVAYTDDRARSAISVASNGGGYVAAFLSFSSVYASIFSGGSWGGESAIDAYTGTAACAQRPIRPTPH